MPERRSSPTPVSVLVPTRDRPDALPAVLAALAEQDTAGLEPELVVVDNDSEAASRATTAAIVAAHPWPARLVDEPRPGVAVARNTATAAAGSELLVFLNDDVVPRGSDWLRGHVEHLQGADDEHACVLGPVTWHPATPRTPVMTWLERTGKSHDYTRVRRGESPPGEWYANNLSMWRGALDAAGGFDPRFTSYGWQEYDLALRLADAGLRIRFVPALEAWHQHHHDLRRSLAREERIGRSAVLFEALNRDRGHLDTPVLPAWMLTAGALLHTVTGSLPLPERLPGSVLRVLHKAALANGIRRGLRDPALREAVR